MTGPPTSGPFRPWTCSRQSQSHARVLSYSLQCPLSCSTKGWCTFRGGVCLPRAKGAEASWAHIECSSSGRAHELCMQLHGVFERKSNNSHRASLCMLCKISCRLQGRYCIFPGPDVRALQLDGPLILTTILLGRACHNSSVTGGLLKTSCASPACASGSHPVGRSLSARRRLRRPRSSASATLAAVDPSDSPRCLQEKRLGMRPQAAKILLVILQFQQST